MADNFAEDFIVVTNPKVRVRIEGFGSFCYFLNNGHVIRVGRLSTLILVASILPLNAYFIYRFISDLTKKPLSTIIKLFNKLCKEGLLVVKGESEEINISINKQNLFLLEERIDEALNKLSSRKHIEYPVAPLWVHIQPFTKCNLNCMHCYCFGGMGGETQKISTQKWISFINRLSQIQVFELILSGGELFLSEDFFRLATAVYGSGLRLKCGSNGTLINKEYAIRALQAGIKKIQISLDGATSATHGKFRGVKNAFNRTLRGIQILKEVGIEVCINVTVHRNNVEEMEELINLARKYSCSDIEFTHIYPAGRIMSNYDNFGFTAGEKQENISKLKLLADKYKDIKVIYGKNCNEQRLEDRINSKTCAAGYTGICVDQEGNVYPCIMGISEPSLVCGNILRQDIEDIWHSSPILKGFRSFTRYNDSQCAACKWFDDCMGFCPTIAVKSKNVNCRLAKYLTDIK